MSILAPQLLVAEAVGQQEHGPPAGAHLVLLAVAIVAALAFLGVRQWRRRRDAAIAAEEERTDSLSAEGRRFEEHE
jgi:type VI protein secretion system component VasK